MRCINDTLFGNRLRSYISHCSLVHKRSKIAKKTKGLKGKLLTKKRHAEKATMKKTIAMHQERDNKHKAEDGAPQNALPAYLMEREQVRISCSYMPFSFSHSVSIFWCIWLDVCYALSKPGVYRCNTLDSLDASCDSGAACQALLNTNKCCHRSYIVWGRCHAKKKEKSTPCCIVMCQAHYCRCTLTLCSECDGI